MSYGTYSKYPLNHRYAPKVYQARSPTIRVLVRYPHACEPLPPEVTPDVVHEELQRELDARGIDAAVDSVRIIKAKRFHYIYPDVWTPVESPQIVAGVIIAVCVAISAICAYLIVDKVAWLAYELFAPKPKYCGKCGEWLPDVAAFETHMRAVHPEEGYVCPYCGLPFPTSEDLAAHMKECPERPMLEKIPFKEMLIVAGIFATVPLAVAVITALRPPKSRS